MPYVGVTAPGVPVLITVISPREIGYLRKLRIENSGTVDTVVTLLDSYARVYFDASTFTAGTESVTGTIISVTVSATSPVEISEFVNTKLYGTVSVISSATPVSVFIDYDVR